MNLINYFSLPHPPSLSIQVPPTLDENYLPYSPSFSILLKVFVSSCCCCSLNKYLVYYYKYIKYKKGPSGELHRELFNCRVFFFYFLLWIRFIINHRRRIFQWSSIWRNQCLIQRNKETPIPTQPLNLKNSQK